MTDDDFAIHEEPWGLPPGVETADPAQRMADDLRRLIRLRDLLRDKRAESREALRVLLRKLLEVADALESILANAPDPNNPAEMKRWSSIRATRKLLAEALRLQNVTPLDLLGQEANPMLCEVDSYETHPDLPDETVVQEVVKGYRWGDESTPLRPAIIVVSRRI